MSDEDLQSVPFTPPLRADASSPKLSWRRGEALEQPTSAAPLYIQERVHPSAFVQGLTRSDAADAQATLFDDFNDLPDEARFRWYQHHGNWSNRLIRGPSLEVMASLLVKDDLAGKVQCIFFDPPYGISFKSLYQQSTRTRNESKDAGSANAEQRMAFRDSYTNGVHSYLDTIHRIASHARELLTESGSFFIQISQENVHRVALVLDEVFGPESRVATIMFAKAGSTSASTLPQVNDYLLWYCRDKQQVKYRQLYEKLDRGGVIRHFSSYAMLETADGTERGLMPAEREKPDEEIPAGSRVFQRMRLLSSHHSTTRSKPFEWNGRVYPCPSNEQWRVSREGLERLAALDRLTSAGEDGVLRWKHYENEVPGRLINNLWGDQMSPSDIRYVVETAESVISRCICMTTDPGELVLDLTCGSGTTAFVAERFGRRWITCDVSGISLALARHRLVTGVFEWYVIQGSPEGQKFERELGGNPEEPTNAAREDDPSAGFVYPRVPRVSAAILAYDQDVDPIHLVDQPIKSREHGLRRVSSSFTVETHSPHRYLTLEDATREDRSTNDDVRSDVEDRIVEAIERDGVRLGDGNRLFLTHVTPADGYRVVTHRARSPGARRFDTCIAVFAPDETVNRFAERRALTEAAQDENVKSLLLVGFGFEGQSEGERAGRILVHRVQAHQDLRIGELAPNREADTLVVIAEPDIELAKTKQGKWTLEVRGFDSYDPASGQVAAHDDINEIELMMVDTDYDGAAFFAREIHFPGQGNDRRLKRLKSQLGKRIDPELWEACLTAKTRPFDPPESGEVAVRIITSAGAEITAVRSVG